MLPKRTIVGISIGLALSSGCAHRAGKQAAQGALEQVRKEAQAGGFGGRAVSHMVDALLVELEKPVQRKRLAALLGFVLRRGLHDLGPELEQLQPALRQTSEAMSAGFHDATLGRKPELVAFFNEIVDGQVTRIGHRLEAEAPALTRQLVRTSVLELGRTLCPSGATDECLRQEVRLLSGAAAMGAKEALFRGLSLSRLLGLAALSLAALVLLLLLLSTLFAYFNRKAALRAELSFWRSHGRPPEGRSGSFPLRPAPQE